MGNEPRAWTDLPYVHDIVHGRPETRPGLTGPTQQDLSCTYQTEIWSGSIMVKRLQ